MHFIEKIQLQGKRLVVRYHGIGILGIPFLAIIECDHRAYHRMQRDFTNRRSVPLSCYGNVLSIAPYHKE